MSLEAIAEQVGDKLAESLSTVLDGAREDLQAYGRSITARAVAAAAISDPEERDALLKEITAQARAVAEIQRIRANKEGWEVAGLLAGLAIDVLILALPSEEA